MRNLFSVSFLFLLVACKPAARQPLSLEEAVMQSFRDDKFSLLEDYLPTKEFYKSLGEEVQQRTDPEIDSFLVENKSRISSDWEKMRENLKEGKVQPEALKFKESLVYKPYPKSSMQAMVVIYDYRGKLFDDLTFIVKEQAGKKFLLGIPVPSSAFRMRDSTLRNSNQARAALEMLDPGFAPKMKILVTELINAAEKEDISFFADRVVYRGEDDNRNWKSAINSSVQEEKNQALALMSQVKAVMSDCPGLEFGQVMGNSESEGYWIIQPVNCTGKTIHFAFLKVGDRFLLGDLDTEGR